VNEQTRNDILLHVAGELDAERAAAVERLLAADADARRFAEMLRGELARLDALSDEPLPASLRDRITRAAVPVGGRRIWRRVGAAVRLLATAAAIVLAVVFALRPAGPATPIERGIAVQDGLQVDPMQLALIDLDDLQAEIDQAFERLESESLDPEGTPLDEDLEEVSASLDDLAAELGLPAAP